MSVVECGVCGDRMTVVWASGDGDDPAEVCRFCVAESRL